MKIRPVLYLLVFSLFLVAFSQVNGIIPTSEYASTTDPSLTITPSIDPSLVATPTPSMESTGIPTNATPVATVSATPTEEASPTPQNNVVAIHGIVTHASGAKIPPETTAILLVYSSVQSQVTQSLTSPLLPDGSFNFENVPADPSNIFLVQVDFNGVTFQSAMAQFNQTITLYEMPVTIYDTTKEMDSLKINQAHLQFDFSTSGQVSVLALYVIVNSGNNATVIPLSDSSVPFIQIPAEATNIAFQLAQESSPLMYATEGFALLPGIDKQYAIMATFSLPYSKSLEYVQPFNLPVNSALVIVPEGVRVKSEQLTDGGTQTISSTTYHIYQGNNLASGSTLTFKLSGLPGEQTFSLSNNRTVLMIEIGAVGLILIGLGIFLFLRDRRLRKLEEEVESEDTEEDDSLGENRDALMDAILALDDKYKAGEISKKAWEQRRNELKDRLRKKT